MFVFLHNYYTPLFLTFDVLYNGRIVVIWCSGVVMDEYTRSETGAILSLDKNGLAINAGELIDVRTFG